VAISPQAARELSPMVASSVQSKQGPASDAIFMA